MFDRSPGAWLKECEYLKSTDAFDFYGVKTEDPALVNNEPKKALSEMGKGRIVIVDLRIAKFGIPSSFEAAHVGVRRHLHAKGSRS